jgi:hypothetical protein
MREKVKKGSQGLRFWRLMPKGEKVLSQSKRTAPPPNFKLCFEKKLVYLKLVCLLSIGTFRKIDSQLVSKFRIYFQLVYIKTLLKTKRRISFRGSFVKSKEKHLK